MSNRDWIKDFPQENGNYQSDCISCGRPFLGHKRRQVCRLCASGEGPIPPEPDLVTVDVDAWAEELYPGNPVKKEIAIHAMQHMLAKIVHMGVSDGS